MALVGAAQNWCEPHGRMSNSSRTFGLEKLEVCVTLMFPCRRLKKHRAVSRGYLYRAAWTKWQMRHYTFRCQRRLYFHEFTSQPALLLWSFWLGCSLFVSALGIRQKALYYSRGMRNIRHPKPFWKKVIIVTADTRLRTDRQRHLASGSPYPTLANNCSSLLASNCPLGARLSSEASEQREARQGEARSDNRRRFSWYTVRPCVLYDKTTK